MKKQILIILFSVLLLILTLLLTIIIGDKIILYFSPLYIILFLITFNKKTNN